MQDSWCVATYATAVLGRNALNKQGVLWSTGTRVVIRELQSRDELAEQAAMKTPGPPPCAPETSWGPPRQPHGAPPIHMLRPPPPPPPPPPSAPPLAYHAEASVPIAPWKTRHNPWKKPAEVVQETQPRHASPPHKKPREDEYPFILYNHNDGEFYIYKDCRTSC